MAIIKCKMCGGELNLMEGASTAECEFCGSVQTVPKVDDEKKLTLFARANRLRAACEFDKAAGIYETIVADFPEEAEAYWGLVLCKYGIEYVDDPGTGKKVPTCHRSSFDSVMDDTNFEQAMENADEAALRVYREEAKQIERIRKGILEVSSAEQPYDIFICYKETDAQGSRTVDSLLAQNIYDALTEKGYRVFFSRITLEDKLGQAYEPYIFAALNSAKIMLAVGTCYEHYNAVWVKNEWSRYLKIIAQDKNKYLIPCYKDIDAYDIPREFAHLQGQDMGKVGAIQDLLRGVEKILPRQNNTTVIQERVVVGGSGGNKIASLLDRGNMALEDGDWAKADSFFEDVLNNDSKNAQAYLGKTLAQEKCRTMDAFSRKRKAATEHCDLETLRLPVAVEHIREKVEAYSVPNYVYGKSIEALYDFDGSYSSQASCRRSQYRNEEKYWAEHKLLSRAEKFAAGAVAENLQREKRALFAALADRVRQAEAAENSAKQEVQARYTVHLRQADAKAEALYEEALAKREKEYQRLLQIAKNATQVSSLYGAASGFGLMGDYQDSKALAEHCRKRAAEEQAKIDAEKERQRIQTEKEEKARRKKSRIITIVSAVAAVIAIVVIMYLSRVVIPEKRYSKAEAALNAGDYMAAESIFRTMGNYRDAAQASTYAHIRYMLAQVEDPGVDRDQLIKEFALKPSAYALNQIVTIHAPESEEPLAQTLDIAFWVLEDILEDVEPEEQKELLENEEELRALCDQLVARGATEESVVEEMVRLYVEFAGDEVAARESLNIPEPFEFDMVMSLESRKNMELYKHLEKQFLGMGDYRDSAEQAEAMRNAQAAITQGHYDGIVDQAKAFALAGEHYKAFGILQELSAYTDTAEYLRKIESIQLDQWEQIYSQAASLMAEGSYEEAMELFGTVEDYKDSKTQRTNCMRLLAKGYEDAGDTENAIGWYRKLKDNESIQRVKYQYVITHKNTQDTLTYEYLMELAESKYQDAVEIYKSLYKIQVRVFYNKDRNDTKTSNTVIYMRTPQGYQSSYGHYQVTANTPSGTVRLRFVYETRWGTDNVAREDWKQRGEANIKEVQGDGQDNVYYLESGSNLYYHRITVYDPVTGQQLAQSTLYRPYD